MSKYFARRIQLQAYFGNKFAYQSAEFGAEAETFEQAQKEVEEAIKLFVQTFDTKELEQLEKPF
jgi:hypothetical protein